MSIIMPQAPAFGAPVPQSVRPEVLDFLAQRRSTSALALSEPAPTADELEALIRVASRTPDHGKLTPWRFIVLEPASKAVFAERLEALAQSRDDARAVAKLAKLKAPPLGVVVVSSPKTSEIPEWEQVLSAGAVCTALLYAAQSMGYGANWITDWYSYDGEATTILGLAAGEKVAGFILLGSSTEPPLERERPDPASLTTAWRP